MTTPAHAQPWLEAALFAPAFGAVLLAVVRDRRARRAARVSPDRKGLHT